MGRKDNAGSRAKRKPTKLTAEQVEQVLQADVINIVREKVKAGKVLTSSERAALVEYSAGGGGAASVPTETASSIAQLCKLLGISRPTFYRYRNQAGAPEKRTNGSYDVAAWRVYLRRAGVSADAGEGRDYLEEEREYRVGLAKLKYEREKREAAIAEGRVVDVDQVAHWMEEQFGALRKRLLSLPDALCPRLARKSKRDVKRILKASMATTLNQFARMHERRADRTTE